MYQPDEIRLPDSSPSHLCVRTDCVISLLAEAAPMSKEAACEFFEILFGFLVACVMKSRFTVFGQMTRSANGLKNSYEMSDTPYCNLIS